MWGFDWNNQYKTKMPDYTIISLIRCWIADKSSESNVLMVAIDVEFKINSKDN